jgi:ADP-heptose:LPS heptosyltransferase
LRKVLFLRLRSLGDCVLMTPCLRVLKERWPHLSLAVVVERPFAGVFTGNPCLNELIVLERRRSTGATAWHRLTVGWALRRRRFDLALNYHGGSTSLLLMRLAGAPLRAGYGHYRSRRAYTHREDHPERFFGGGPLHTVQFQLALLASLGLPVPEPLPDPEIHLDPGAVANVSDRLAGWGAVRGGYIHIHPTATLFTKQWPPEAFAGLIRRLRERFPHPVVLTAGPAEGAVLDAVEAALGSALPRATDLSIQELTALADGAAAFIGCDSGPTHLAAARKTKVCVVFGSSNARAWHPWGTDYRLVRHPFPCQPCPGYECAAFGRPRCILEIPPEEVFDAFCDLMR